MGFVACFVIGWLAAGGRVYCTDSSWVGEPWFCGLSSEERRRFRLGGVRGRGSSSSVISVDSDHSRG